MTRLDVLGDEGPTRGLFRKPTGVALFQDGTAYVTDPDLLRVLRLIWKNNNLTPDGELAPPPGGWKCPGVALDSGKTLYVADAGRDQILVYSPAGVFRRALGPGVGKLKLSAPQSLSVMDPGEVWSFYHDHYLFVTDQDGTRLIRIGLENPEKENVLAITSAVLPASALTAHFAWTALDFYENVWVTDSVRCHIDKLDRNLRLLASYGGPGEGDGLF